MNGQLFFKNNSVMNQINENCKFNKYRSPQNGQNYLSEIVGLLRKYRKTKTSVCILKHLYKIKKPISRFTYILFCFIAGAPVSINKEDKILRCIVLSRTFDAPTKCLFQEFC